MVADSMVINPEPDLKSGHNGIVGGKAVNFKASRLSSSLRLPKLTQTVVPTVFTYNPNNIVKPRIQLVNEANGDRVPKLNVSDSAIVISKNKANTLGSSPKRRPNLSFNEKEVPKDQSSPFCLKTSSNSGDSSPPYLKASNAAPPEVDKMIGAVGALKVQGNSPIRTSMRFVTGKFFGGEVKVHGGKSGFGFSRLCSGDGDEDEDKDTNVDSPGTNLSNGDTNTNTTCLISEVNFHETETFLNVSTHGVPRFSALSTTGSQSVTTTRREQPIGGELLRSDATMSPKNNRHSSNNENSKIQVKSRNEYKYDLTTLETTSSTSHVPSALYEFDKRRHQGSPDKDKVSVPSSPPYSSPTESQYRLYQPSLQQIEKLPEGVELTLSELEEMACRQQHQIDAQRQLLAAKEQRLRFLKQHEARHQQVAVEHERLRRLRDRVEAQELKLKKLRALRGQVDHTKLNNASLTSDLKSIRALFNEKEKELSMAVAKVEELTLQLEDLKKGRGSIPSPPSTATSELDKLRRELMYRNKLNEQQSVRLTQQREALALRQEEVSAIDRRISELQDRLQRKRLSNQQMAEQLSNAGNKPNDQLTRNTLSSSALQHHIQHHQLKYQEQKMNSCPSVPLYQSVHLQSNKQSHKDRIEPFSQVPSSKAPDIESDFLKNVNNNNNISSNNNNINNNNNNNNIYQLSNSMNQRKISQDDFQTSNCLNNKNLISEISSTKHISNYNVNNSNQNKCSINSLSNHVTNNNLINRTALTNMEPKLSPNSNDRLSEFSVSKSDPKYQTLPYNTKFTLDYNPSNPPAQSKFSNCAAVRKPGEGNESVPNDNIELNQGQNMVHGMPVHSSSMKALGAPLANQNQPKHLLPPPLPPPSSSSPASSSSSSSSVNLAPRVYNLSGPMASSLLTRGQPVGGASSTTSSTTSLATTSSSAGSSTNNSNQGILRDLKVGSSQNSMTPNTNLDSVHNKPALPPKPALPGKPTPPPPPRQSALWAPLHENSDNQRLLSEHISNEASRFAQLEFLDITNSRLMEKRPKPVVDISSEAVDTALNVLRGSVNVSSRGGNSMEQVNSKNKPESQSESSSPLPPPPQSDQPIEERRHDKQLMKPWPSITKKQSPPDQNHVKNDKNIDLTNDTTNNEVMNVHVSLNRRIEMPPAFFFPENATPPADLIASANQESYDQLDRSFPKQNCDEVLSSKLHNDAKENGSGGSDSSQENIFSSETTSNESQEESNVAVRIKKGNLKGGNGHSNGLKRRVSFDPLALLLDASLEGELELVMKTAGQVKDPSAANDEGITALHNAICAGHIDIVRFLVQFGCDVNAQDSDGWTPLHCAASCNNVAMVRFLVEHGACIFAQTLSDHETAAEKCEEDEEGFDGCSEFLYSVQEKLGILNNGAVYAVFDYEAHNPDELSFREGDRLIVLRKGDECEKEWWWSRHSDREGYIPRNLLGLYPRVRPNKAASE